MFRDGLTIFICNKCQNDDGEEGCLLLIGTADAKTPINCPYDEEQSEWELFQQND